MNISAYTIEIFFERHIIATFDAVSDEPPNSKKLSFMPTPSIPSDFSKILQSSVCKAVTGAS